MPRPGTPAVHPEMVRTVRAIAEDAMTDECTITRGGTRTFDRAAMKYTGEAGATQYDGPCRIQPDPGRDKVVEAGGELVTLRRFTVSLPLSAIDVKVDDHVTFTASRDPGLIGRQMRVINVAAGSYEGQRHLTCFDDLG
jgi:hypothetical protein